jgi:hypothetical protein
MGLIMIGLAASELLHLYLHETVSGWISVALVLAIPLAGWRAMKMREFYLLGVCFVLLVLVAAYRADAVTVMATGLHRSAYLASFILLMGFLRDGAITSPSILSCGRYITRQPPKRRYTAIFTGSHLFSVMINLGSMSLLAPIIQRGVRGDRSDFAELDMISQVREQRQLAAALRGFAWFLVWAPTAVTQAILPTLMPGIDPFRLIGLGIMIAAAMLALGWLEDIVRWQPLRRRLAAAGTLPVAERTSPPWRAIGNLALVCAALFALTFAFLEMADVTIVTGAMLAAPIVVIVWIAFQQGGGEHPAGNPGGSLGGNLGERLGIAAFVSMPGFVREAVFLGCAGFIGTLAAALVPADRIAAALELGQVPGWQIMLALSLAVLLAGQVGLSPITMAVFLGSVYAKLSDMPVEPTLAALAIAAGTAIASTGAPFSSAVAMLARVSGHDTFTLTWRWNGVFTLLSIALLALIYVLLAG